MDDEIKIVDAKNDHLESVTVFLNPFMEKKLLIGRTSLELALLLKHAFIAIDVADGDRIVGFAALEIYSKKMAEIQCLSVADSHRRKGIGRELVERCVARSREQKVLELMAISSSEELFRNCGFDYSLPSQKRALFLQTRDDD